MARAARLLPSISASIFAALLGCGGADEPEADPLDPDTIHELATAQGSASGSEFDGLYSVTLTTTSCDCPTLALDGEPLDLCALASVLAEATLQVIQTDGFLVLDLGEGMLTGALDADGSFTVAGEQDRSTLLGPVELLGRMDGTLARDGAGATLESSAAQRVLGELGGDAIDCRWLGDVSGTRL